MNISTVFLKVQKEIEIRLDTLMTVDVNLQKRYIAGLPEPRDNIERSFFQYKCQRFLRPWWLSIGINLGVLPIMVYFLLKLLFGVHGLSIEPKHMGRACFMGFGNSLNIIPDNLRKEYLEIIDDRDVRIDVDSIDKKYILQILKRYPLSWEFILKNIIKIGNYQYIINKYSPCAIITPNEYSYTSSVLTDYCNKKGIEHIDVMHGDKHFYIGDSFFYFNRCYVWDEFYCRLFYSLRADKNEFIVEIPSAIKFFHKESVLKSVDITYYLGLETENQLYAIRDTLLKLLKKGLTISVRPHPRYSDNSKVKKIFFGWNIEDADKVPIETSILRTRTAVSLHSTVLFQAYFNGTEIAVDDVSRRADFLKLKKMNYIMLDKGCKLLSEIL